MFRVGQKVVCLKTWPIMPHLYEFSPIKDKVYTIRHLIEDGTEPSLRVCEIVNQPSHSFSNIIGAIEAAWMRRYFRPVVETDISVFTEILDKVNRKVRLPAE